MSPEEIQALEALEKTASAKSGSDGIDIEVELDDNDRLGTPGWKLCVITKAVKETSTKGVPMLFLSFKCLEGADINKYTNDRIMLDGAGKKRLPIFAEAAGFYNSETKRVTIPSMAALVNKRVMVNWVIEPERVDDGSSDPSRKGRVYPARNSVHPWDGYKKASNKPAPSVEVPEVDEGELIEDPFNEDGEVPKVGSVVPVNTNDITEEMASEIAAEAALPAEEVTAVPVVEAAADEGVGSPFPPSEEVVPSE